MENEMHPGDSARYVQSDLPMFRPLLPGHARSRQRRLLWRRNLSMGEEVRKGPPPNATKVWVMAGTSPRDRGAEMGKMWLATLGESPGRNHCTFPSSFVRKRQEAAQDLSKSRRLPALCQPFLLSWERGLSPHRLHQIAEDSTQSMSEPDD